MRAGAVIELRSGRALRVSSWERVGGMVVLHGRELVSGLACSSSWRADEMPKILAGLL